MANSDIIQAFAIQDPFTNDKISKMLGETTVWSRRVRAQGRREGATFETLKSEAGFCCGPMN